MTILNYGSLNIDHVYRVPHFVQPGETLSCELYDLKPGGKGANQSAAAALAGAIVHHAGQVGADGGFLLEQLNECGVDTARIRVGKTPTGHAIIQVDDKGENAIVLYGGGNQSITQTDIDQVLSNYDNTTTLLLQNEISNVPYLMRSAAERGMKICLNPAPMDKAVSTYPLELVDTLIVNETEGKALGGGTSMAGTLNNLVDAYPNATIILTLGADGVVARYGDDQVVIAAETVNVVDTTAAGDTFIGYYLARIEAGDSVPAALKIANHASAITVSRPGAMPSIPNLKEVLA